MNNTNFTLGEIITHDESYSLEFKEVKGKNPIDTIKNTCDEYVVAFLNCMNCNEGSILWGVTDSEKKVVGVKLLDHKIRDQLRKAIDGKLSQIKPPIAPSSIEVFFHPIFENQKQIEGNYIIEIRISTRNEGNLYATASGEVYIKTQSGKKKLSHEEILAEHQQRIERKKKKQRETTYESENTKLIDIQKFILSFDEDGNILNEDMDLWTLAKEAYYLANQNEIFSFTINLQKMDKLNDELKLFDKKELSYNERYSRVVLLEEISKLVDMREKLVGALELLFFKEIRNYVNDPYEIGLVIKGLGKRVIARNFHRFSDELGLDVWRKDFKDVGTAIWIPRVREEKIDNTSLRNLFWAGEADIYDLGQQLMMEVAVPAILLEVLRIQPEMAEADIADLLTLSAWSFGIH